MPDYDINGTVDEQNDPMANSIKFFLVLVLIVAGTLAIAQAENEVSPQQTVQPFDVLHVQVLGAPKDDPIDGLYVVEPTTHVSLGPTYGRIDLRGKSIDAAEQVLRRHLAHAIVNPTVQLKPGGRAHVPELPAKPEFPFRIRAGHHLAVCVRSTRPESQQRDVLTVDDQGRIPLGPANGRVDVGGLTLDEAEIAVTRQVEQVLHEPRVSVTLGGWRLESATEEVLQQQVKRLENEVQELRRYVDEIRKELVRTRGQDSSSVAAGGK